MSGGVRRLLGAAAISAAVLGGAELAARAVPVPDTAAPTSVQDGGGQIMLRGSPWLLWELSPGRHEELGVTVTVNADGFRGPERGPKTRPRLLALGDSSIYGFGVEDDEVFTAVLERDLGVDAVNGGVPGYSSYQSLNLLNMRGMALEPDVLVVGNLWSDNNFDTFVDDELVASYAGWEGSWTRDVRVAAERSALFRVLDWGLRVAPASERARKVSWELGGKTGRSGERRVDIAAYARNLDTYARLMAARGGGVVFVMLANREDLEAPPGQPAWGPYRDVMRDAAERWDAPLVVLPDVFRASGLSPDALLVDRMHPSARGHALLAGAVAAALRERGWPERPLALTPPTSPLPAYTDPFVGRAGPPQPTPPKPPGAPPGTLPIMALLKLTVAVPQYERGNVVLDVAVPGQQDRRVLGAATLRAPGTAQIALPELPEQIVVRAYLDVAGDGPTPGDPFAIMGPVPLPPDHTLSLDFAGATFSGE